MKKSNLILLIGFFTLTQISAKDYELLSPEGVNKMVVHVEDNISISVFHNDKVVTAKSPLSITVDGKQLGVKPNVRKTSRRNVNEVVKPIVRVKRAEIGDNYNELTISFRGNYALICRSYDEGVAYRLSTRLKGEVTIDAEEVAFNFSEDKKGSFPIADGFFTHYERNAVNKSIGEFGTDEMSCLPALIHLDDGVKAVITEADLYDYPGFYLAKNTNSSLKGLFPNYPKEYRYPDDRDVVPTKREAFLAKTNGTRAFPWRMIAISDNDSELLQNEMVYLLSTERKLTDTDWIKPGKVAWDWYNANNIFGVDFESGINTETYKYYIDFASKYGLEYIVLDEGWYDIKTNDLINPVADIDMIELMNYGKEKNVDIILWVTWKALEDDLIDALDQFAKWNVKGIKVDFMQRDDQWMVQYYERVAKEAAARKMLVDFHGSYKPSGLRRAYPNVISREGLKGLEQHKWEGQFANPEHDVEIPFTRMLAGPMDYTPGAMINAQKENYRWNFERPMSLGTRCHQLAMYVIYESPLQMLADTPSHYLKEQECMEFLSVVPTVWDDTRVLAAKFGDYVATARKSGEEWYVGAMTDWDARDLELDFSFLPEGEFQIDIYQDGVNANRYGSDYKRTTQKIMAGNKMTIHMAPGGGWAARIKPINP